jgi:hypothetical protein
LEIDHFRPRSAGGGDEIDNLVYCCPTCNRLKGEFWPTGDPAATPRRLLHPKQVPLSAQIREEEDGRLTALTETGAFHIERLRLNRPPLIALRRGRREVRRLHQELRAIQQEQDQLHKRIIWLEMVLVDVLQQLNHLLGLKGTH